MVLGCVRAIDVSKGARDGWLPLDLKLVKKLVGKVNEGIDSRLVGLDGVESVGDELKDGGVSAGGLS